MIHVVIVGDQKFYHDASQTRAQMGHFMLDAIGDMEQSIAGLARRFAPGKLGAAVRAEMPVAVGNIYRGAVGVRREPRHAEFVHEGTGIYGPLHRPYTLTKRQTQGPPVTSEWGRDRTGRINPAVGNVFRITSGGGDVYYRRRVTVQGQRPQPFLTEAFELAKRTEVPLRVQRLARQIAR